MFDFETFADVVGCYVAGACEVVSTSGSSSIRFDEEESCVGKTVLREPLRFMTRFTDSLQCSSRFDNQVVEDPSREQHFPLPLRLMQFPLVRQVLSLWPRRFFLVFTGESSADVFSRDGCHVDWLDVTGRGSGSGPPSPEVGAASSCALKFASMWQHAHQVVAKAVGALYGSDGCNARDDVNIILRGMSGLLKRLTVCCAVSFLIPTLLKRDMVLGKSALPEAT